MNEDLTTSLASIRTGPIEVKPDDTPADFGQAPIVISFADGTRLLATYWRLVKDSKAFLSSFDDRQRYGGPAPIDAVATLGSELTGRSCSAVQLDEDTGDLVLQLSDRLRLRVFNFTSYEIWQIIFPNGGVQYSNYVG